MPISFFDAESSEYKAQSDLPFVKDYVLQLGDSFTETCSIITSAKHTRTGTGVLLFTEHYKFMLFNGSKAIAWLSDLLTQWVKHPATGNVLICQTISKYPYYRIGIDDSVRALWLVEGNGWSCMPDTTSQSSDTLPLIPSPTRASAETTTPKGNKNARSAP